MLYSLIYIRMISDVLQQEAKGQTLTNWGVTY